MVRQGWASTPSAVRRWRTGVAVALVAAVWHGGRTAEALVQTTQQAAGSLIRSCGTPVIPQTAATAVQQDLNATMKVGPTAFLSTWNRCGPIYFKWIPHLHESFSSLRAQGLHTGDSEAFAQQTHWRLAISSTSTAFIGLGVR